MLFAVFQYLATNITLAVALTILYQQHALNAIEIIPALIMFSITLTMVILFVIGLRSVAQLKQLLAPPIHFANRLLRREFISEAAIHRFLDDATDGIGVFRRQPLNIQLMPFALALSGESLLIILMSTIFVALRQPVSPTTIIIGVSMATLFSVVSPTQLGIGLAEGAVALVLSALNIPLESAVIISVTYRGFVVWLPMLYGFIALQASGLRTITSRT